METKENPETRNELDCSVTVYDGSWMTCDMIPEQDADTQDRTEERMAK